jgi:predicted ribosome-associated RNA-binding protein Tma20
MKGSINKEMVENMNRKESFKSKLGGNQLAPKTECEDKKKEKRVVILFNKGKIIFLEMKKFPTMDCWKKCRVSLECQCFWFAWHAIDSNLTIGGVSISHHMV